MATQNPNKDCLPFLKWAGGKRWFASQYAKTLTIQIERYVEPFLGSGALFFALNPKRAILSDLNSELIETFAAIKDDWQGIVTLLKRYQRLHSKHFYYKMRSVRPRSDTGRAARFIYLNRTCWNGLYRVNLRGEFNVPKGTKKNVILATDNFRDVSQMLKGASLFASDFEAIIRQAVQGDLVFADPPYATSHSNNGFLKYNETLFGWEDQLRLKSCLIAAKRKGAHVLSTNADSPPIWRLYEEDFAIRRAVRPSVIAGKSAGRGISSELVITSF